MFAKRMDGFSKAVGFGQGLLTLLRREGQEQPVFLDLMWLLLGATFNLVKVVLLQVRE